MTRVLVTGATGFVGMSLVPFLRQRGFWVRSTVRQEASQTPTSDETVVISNIDQHIDWRPALSGMDAVIHLAGRAHIMQESNADPLAAYRSVNRDGTVTLAQQAVETGVKRLVFLSSIKVNGDNTQPGRPFRADDSVAPTDPYGLSKYEAEQALSQIQGLEAVVVRPPLIYGPGVKANFLRMVNLVHKGLPLPLASVKNRRSMVGVMNLSDLLATCVESPQAAGETFLVSDNDDVSTPQLLRLIAESLGVKSRLLPFPPKLLATMAGLLGKGPEVSRLCGSLHIDMTKTQSVLDWAPPVSLAQGISDTTDWFVQTRVS